MLRSVGDDAPTATAVAARRRRQVCAAAPSTPAMRILPKAQREAMYRGLRLLPRRRRHRRRPRPATPPSAPPRSTLARRHRRALRRRRRRRRRAIARRGGPHASTCERADFHAVIDGMAMDAAADIRAPGRGDARPLLRPGRVRGRPAVGADLRHGRRARRRARPPSRPRAAAHQHPARHRRGRRASAGSTCRARRSRPRASRSTTPLEVAARSALAAGLRDVAAERARRISPRPTRSWPRAPRGHAERAAPDGGGLSLDCSTRMLRARLGAAAHAGRRPKLALLVVALLRYGLIAMSRRSSTSSARASPASRPPRCAGASAGRASCVHRGSGAGGRPLPLLLRPAARARRSTTAITCVLSGNPAVARLSRARSARRTTAAGPDAGRFRLRRPGERRALDGAARTTGRLPWWIFDASAPRAGHARPATICALAAAARARRPGATVGDAMRCDGPAVGPAARPAAARRAEHRPAGRARPSSPRAMLRETLAAGGTRLPPAGRRADGLCRAFVDPALRLARRARRDAFASAAACAAIGFERRPRRRRSISDGRRSRSARTRR